MRLAPTLLALGPLTVPFPAFACGDACASGLVAFGLVLLMGGGFVSFVLGKLVLGRFL